MAAAVLDGGQRGRSPEEMIRELRATRTFLGPLPISWPLAAGGTPSNG